MTMKYAKMMKTIELNNGEDGKKPPSSLRHGEPGTKTAARIIAVRITMEITDHTRPRDSSAESSAESSLPSASRSPRSLASSGSISSVVGTSCRHRRCSKTSSMNQPAMRPSTIEDAILKKELETAVTSWKAKFGKVPITAVEMPAKSASKDVGT